MGTEVETRSQAEAQIRWFYWFASYGETFLRLARRHGEHEAYAYAKMVIEYALWGVRPADNDSEAYDRFVSSLPSIDINVEKMKQGDCGVLGGRPRKNPTPKPHPETPPRNPTPKPSRETEGEEEVEVEKEEKKSMGGAGGKIDDLFAQFWTAYPSACPRKIDKKKCLEKFRRIVCDAHGARMEIFKRLMDGLEAWKKSDLWTKDDGQFICAPAVWLNGSRWEDAPLASRRQAQEEPEKPCVIVYDAREDWLKCAEDCANCTGNGCSRGIKVPPVYEAHPFPPRECNCFRPIGR